MEAMIQVHKDGKYFVAEDLITQVADQGLTEAEAIANLKKGLKERYHILTHSKPHAKKLIYTDIPVEKNAAAPSGFC